jgi:multiple sugar transport system substrate-binding protein
MDNTYRRRQIIKQGLSGLAGLSLFGLAGCTSSTSMNTLTNPVSAQPTSGELHMLFWGSPTRDKLTRATFDQFHQQNPNFTITSKYYTFNDYFNKLDALIASGNAPDLIQMDMRYIAQYVRRKQLLDLTEIIYNQTIDLSDFDPLLLSSSKVNNTVYGVPLGGNYQTLFYNMELLEKSGLGAPPANLTWDTFATYAADLTRALGGNVYASQDASTDVTNFELWVRQRGKEIYTRDGQVNFTQEDVGDWYSYWSKLRDARGCLPWSIQKNQDISGSATDSSVVQGKAVFSFNLSNLFESYQKGAFAISPLRKMNMMVPPTGGSGSIPGIFLKTSQLLSISATTKYQQTAVKYANFIINDVGAIKKLGIERGIPGSAKALNLLQPQLTDIQRTIANYVTAVSGSGQTSVKTVLDPPGAGKVQDLLRSVANDIASGKRTVTQGAQAFYTQAKKVAAG